MKFICERKNFSCIPMSSKWTTTTAEAKPSAELNWYAMMPRMPLTCSKNMYAVHSNLHWLFFYACGSVHFLSLWLSFFRFQYFLEFFHRRTYQKCKKIQVEALCFQHLVWISLASRQVNQLNSFRFFASFFILAVAIRLASMVVTLFLPKSIHTVDCLCGEKHYYSIYWVVCKEKKVNMIVIRAVVFSYLNMCAMICNQYVCWVGVLFSMNARAQRWQTFLAMNLIAWNIPITWWLERARAKHC